jgi:hypothetical protein
MTDESRINSISQKLFLASLEPLVALFKEQGYELTITVLKGSNLVQMLITDLKDDSISILGTGPDAQSAFRDLINETPSLKDLRRLDSLLETARQLLDQIRGTLRPLDDV